MSKQIDLFNHGYVRLENVMGNDLDILNNARVSFDSHETELDDRGRGVLNFLMRERHGSPWEAVVFRFVVRAPIFVNREWFRHRIGSFNEESLRYSPAKAEYYVPAREDIREQRGKPGNYTFEPITNEYILDEVEDHFKTVHKQAIASYNHMIDLGVARELARDVLPVGMFSTFVWTVNMRALFNFLSLRNHPHALLEIRRYAEAVEELATEASPYALELFNRHGRVSP